MNDSMEKFSARLRNAHASIKDVDGVKTEKRLSKDDDHQAATKLYNDINSDLEAYRGLLAKLGCPRAEAIVKSLLQNCQDAKDAMDDEVANSK